MKLIYGVDVLDGLKQLQDESVHCCITSPPYWGLRDYGADGQIGLEKTPDEFVQKLVAVFHEVKRVLRDDGTLWLNLGDSYNGNKNGNTEILKNKKVVSDSFEKKLWDGAKQKDLVGIPWMVAFALRSDGWYLRQDIIWAKPNPMPESVTDRCTKAHEYIFLLSKSSKYYFDADAIREPQQEASLKRMETVGKAHNNFDKYMGKSKEEIQELKGANKRSVWTVTTHPHPEAHFATFPQELVMPMILAGCPPSGIVLDPFSGSGTTGAVATGCGRDYIGIDINKNYLELARQRIGLLATA